MQFLFGNSPVASSFFSSPVAAVLTLVVLFLVIREIVTWYWKLNKICNLLEQIEENTRSLLPKTHEEEAEVEPKMVEPEIPQDPAPKKEPMTPEEKRKLFRSFMIAFLVILIVVSLSFSVERLLHLISLG